MARARTSIVIGRPVEDVFAVVTDPERNVSWSSSVSEARLLTERPVRVGSRARFVGRFMGRRIESEQEVAELEPNQRFVAATTKPFPFRVAMTFTPLDGRTRLDVELEAEPGGFFRFGESLAVGMARRQFEADLARLKELMEAGRL